MHDCITDHPAVNIYLSLTFLIATPERLKISSADDGSVWFGGQFCRIVHFLFSFAILVLFSSVGRCVRGDVSCTVCVCVGVYK